MARFTAGERRGLFVLIIVLGLLTLYLVVRNALATQQTVTPPSVCSVDTIAISDTVSAGLKADSAAVKPSRRKRSAIAGRKLRRVEVRLTKVSIEPVWHELYIKFGRLVRHQMGKATVCL